MESPIDARTGLAITLNRPLSTSVACSGSVCACTAAVQHAANHEYLTSCKPLEWIFSTQRGDSGSSSRPIYASALGPDLPEMPRNDSNISAKFAATHFQSSAPYDLTNYQLGAKRQQMSTNLFAL
uniref:Uncharacterized protein n=1 Tax=Peronospora matthiolae TaxID=2874970 RepID=A0AAV1TTU2_9STRA